MVATVGRVWLSRKCLTKSYLSFHIIQKATGSIDWLTKVACVCALERIEYAMERPPVERVDQ